MKQDNQINPLGVFDNAPEPKDGERHAIIINGESKRVVYRDEDGFKYWEFMDEPGCINFDESVPYMKILDQVSEQSGGSKFDDEKPPMELLPPNGLIEVAKAMGYGAKKYNESWPDMNWPKVKNARRRYLGAALRHIMARLSGEIRDPESGHLHVAHAAFCLLCVCELDGEYRKEIK